MPSWTVTAGMGAWRGSQRVSRRVRGTAHVAALLVLGPGFAWADPAAREATQLVEQATFAIENFAADPSLPAFRKLVPRAKGVFVAPQLLKAAFVVGASGGRGVLVVRDEKSGEWQGPAFYTLGGASLGLQIGAEASEVVVLAMTGRGVTAMLKPSVKIGADVNLAVGPVGAGAEGATQNLSVDLIAFSRSQGLYGGVSLQGAVLAVRADWNQAYYGKPVSPTDILIRGDSANLQADRLLAAVRQVVRDSKVAGES